MKSIARQVAMFLAKIFAGAGTPTSTATRSIGRMDAAWSDAVKAYQSATARAPAPGASAAYRGPARGGMARVRDVPDGLGDAGRGRLPGESG